MLVRNSTGGFLMSIWTPSSDGNSAGSAQSGLDQICKLPLQLATAAVP
jgi:hypothetical protein